ncbi:MAG: hypothetical protein PHC64_05270 [Candidatus Gastranaerophilales bacterium]|nr:hypothetical protein [Candidatus Gastranaerophilales bacterium]
MKVAQVNNMNYGYLRQSKLQNSLPSQEKITFGNTATSIGSIVPDATEIVLGEGKKVTTFVDEFGRKLRALILNSDGTTYMDARFEYYSPKGNALRNETWYTNDNKPTKKLTFSRFTGKLIEMIEYSLDGSNSLSVTKFDPATGNKISEKTVTDTRAAMLRNLNLAGTEKSAQ